jgi:guanylate kinase
MPESSLPSNGHRGSNGNASPADDQHPGAHRNTRRLVVLSAPSGAGKTTIARRLVERNPNWRFSVSATTREMRSGEHDGEDYHFLTVEEFRRRIAAGDLVEWEEIFGSLYGTLRSEIERLLDERDGRILFDVDVRGALAIRRAFPHDAFLVFVAPPSFEELVRRLKARQTESAEAIERRIARAAMELEMRPQFDAIVVNDTVDRATEEIEGLVRGQ